MSCAYGRKSVNRISGACTYRKSVDSSASVIQVVAEDHIIFSQDCGENFMSSLSRIIMP